jgi:hypothetical protein
MMKVLRLALPVVAAYAVLIVGGAVHGLWTDRWTVSGAVEDAVGRLEQVPPRAGDWEVRSQEQLPSRDVALAGAAGYLYRTYENRRSGERVALLIMAGHPGPLSVHTPDICYGGLGYQPNDDIERWAAPAGAGGRRPEFFTAKFLKQGGTAPPLRVLWTWGAAGTWQAPDNPRLSLASQPAVFKLYLVRALASEKERLEDDPCADFIGVMFPKLQGCLFAQDRRPVTGRQPSGKD